MQNRLQYQDKTIQALRSQLSDSETYKRFTELQTQLKEATSKNAELVKQLRTMERIQQGQGRALEKMTNDNEYPRQIRDL